MSDDLDDAALRQIKACDGYMGFSERAGIVILCEAMGMALRLLLAIYRRRR